MVAVTAIFDGKSQISVPGFPLALPRRAFLPDAAHPRLFSLSISSTFGSQGCPILHVPIFLASYTLPVTLVAFAVIKGALSTHVIGNKLKIASTPHASDIQACQTLATKCGIAEDRGEKCFLSFSPPSASTLPAENNVAKYAPNISSRSDVSPLEIDVHGPRDRKRLSISFDDDAQAKPALPKRSV